MTWSEEHTLLYWYIRIWKSPVVSEDRHIPWFPRSTDWSHLYLLTTFLVSYFSFESPNVNYLQHCDLHSTRLNTTTETPYPTRLVSRTIRCLVRVMFGTELNTLFSLHHARSDDLFRLESDSECPPAPLELTRAHAVISSLLPVCLCRNIYCLSHARTGSSQAKRPFVPWIPDGSFGLRAAYPNTTSAYQTEVKRNR